MGVLSLFSDGDLCHTMDGECGCGVGEVKHGKHSAPSYRRVKRIQQQSTPRQCRQRATARCPPLLQPSRRGVQRDIDCCPCGHDNL